MRRFAYVASLLFVFIFPSIIIGALVWPQIVLGQLVIFVASITILGVVWDLWATKHGKHDNLWIWSFNKRDTLGIQLFDMPIEEYLFYPVSALYIIFLWEGIRYGYAERSMEMLIALSTLAIWTCMAVILSYRLSAKKQK